MSLPRLENGPARRLFLDRHALLEPPTGPATGAGLLALIDRLGFVQVDSVQTVARAHHMILHARRTGYRPPALKRLLERDRSVFEHWTHDAAILPLSAYPHWMNRFPRDKARIERRWKTWRDPGYEERFAPVRDHIRRHGPARSDTFTHERGRPSDGWWDWHPSKTALEFLWRSGELAVARRDGFRKVYDLAERVLPAAARAARPPLSDTLDWACSGALDRLGFASPGELAAFWDLATPAEARGWCAAALARGEICEIAVEGADGRLHRRYARPDAIERAHALPPPVGAIRVLSPFDPALRDRARAERLFGFRYRIEIFVPAAQRRYGYYVFPLLEGDRLIGRVDMTADRAAGCLRIAALWPERGVRMGAGRRARLEAALMRTARLAGLDRLEYAPGWLRDQSPKDE